MTHRRAFTLVELLMVLTIILILTALGIGHFGQAMRKAAVHGAADQILKACDQARQLALQDSSGTDRYYGVRLEADSDGATVALIVQEDGGSAALEGPDGEPLLSYHFPSAAVVWEGDTDLASGSGELEWYFLPGSGEIAEVVGGSIRERYVGVGTLPVATGALWGLASNASTSPVIAPATATVPGLSVRTPDNRYRIAIGAYPSGLAFSTVAEEDR